MLSEMQKNKFTARARQEVRKLLAKLKIENINDDNICDLQELLDLSVSGLI